MAIQTEKTINIIRGKNLVGKASKGDIFKLLEHIDALEAAMDLGDEDDFWGTEGWRHRWGID